MKEELMMDENIYGKDPHEEEMKKESIGPIEEQETREPLPEEPRMDHETPLAETTAREEPVPKKDVYAYRGSSSYEPQSTPHKKRKGVSGFTLVAVALIFTLLGTGLGLYGAYEILPETSLFQQSKLGQMITAAQAQGPTFISTPEQSKDGLTIPEIVEMVQPAVVTVSVEVQSFSGFFNPQGRVSESIGTGFILTEGGLIATNYHVVEGGQNIKVTLYDGTEVSARMVNYDASNDLAVLQMDETVAVPGTVVLGDSDHLQVGESVIAIGNPLSKDFAGSVTSGIVSATERAVTINGTEYMFLQTDAAINGGNSGGPLINERGEVIGINSAKIATESVEGIGFAIPINTLIDGLDVLSRAQLIVGIAGREIDEATATENDLPVGVLVVEVQNNTPAYLAAMMVGDVITEFDGQKVQTVTDINNIKNTKEAGDVVIVKVYREGMYMDLRLTLRERR
ncbi:MAG TPA: hypothetical protein DEA52_05870 [Clostridiaceae bacterium]|nr:hypothetical protein [Clostridiaceae bacterium]